MKYTSLFILVNLLFSCVNDVFAQDIQEPNGTGIHQHNELKRKASSKHLFAEAITYVSSGKDLPFWLRSNQYGIIPDKPIAFGFHGSIWQDSIKLGKSTKWSWGYGAEIATFASGKPNFLIPQLYAKLKFKSIELVVGRQKEQIGLTDSTVSMGSVIWSGNALPMTKIKIQSVGYVPLAFKGGLSAKFYYAHGWFDNQGLVQDYYLHQKYLYFRIGRESSKVKFYSGLNHQVQWAGKSSNWNATQAKNGLLPSDLNAYLKIVLPLKGLGSLDTTNSVYYDYGNQPGNHLGTMDIGAEFSFKKFNLFVYKQSMYEDGRLFSGLTNFDDGLYGIRVKTQSKALNTVLFEVLYTKNQGQERSYLAKLLGLSDRHPGEIQDYQNHGQYLDGWSYLGKGLGTPFFSRNIELANPLTTDYNPFFINNRIIGYNIGLKGMLSTVTYATKFSYTINQGGFYYTFANPRTQFSSIVTLQKNVNWLNKSSLNVALSYDGGTLLPNNFGARIGLRKEF